MTTQPTTHPRHTPFDAATDIHLTGPFTPVTADLDGAYLRNGPNPR